MEVTDQDCSKTTEGTISKKTLADMEDKTVEKNTEIIGMVVTIEVGIYQEKDCSQEIMAIIGIEVQVIVDRDQDLELILIDTEKYTIIVGIMIILQGIVPPLEKRET